MARHRANGSTKELAWGYWSKQSSKKGEEQGTRQEGQIMEQN